MQSACLKGTLSGTGFLCLNQNKPVSCWKAEKYFSNGFHVPVTAWLLGNMESKTDSTAGERLRIVLRMKKRKENVPHGIAIK